jgi:hypothetical protein
MSDFKWLETYLHTHIAGSLMLISGRSVGKRAHLPPPPIVVSKILDVIKAAEALQRFHKVDSNGELSPGTVLLADVQNLHNCLTALQAAKEEI